MLAYTKHIDFTSIIILGDLFDFYAVSNYSRNPYKRDLLEETEKAGNVLRQFTDAFKEVPDKIILEGNHEDRLRRYVWDNAPSLHGLSELSVEGLYSLNTLGWRYMSELPVIYRVGKLHIVHGHEYRISAGAVNLARLFYLRAGVNVMAGHHHRTSQWVQRRLDGKYEGGWTIGCLCDLCPEYSPFNNWNHGFAIVTVRNGLFSVDNKIIINREVI